MKIAAVPLVALLTLTGPKICSVEKEPLDAAEQAQLKRDKILVTAREYHQSFTPYIHNDLPVFITSDALLNAFHVIFEESFARMEGANVAKLETLLEEMVKSLPQA